MVSHDDFHFYVCTIHFPPSLLIQGEVAAVKVMEAVLDKEEDIKGELNVFLNHSHHPNIVDFHGAFLKRNGTLDDHLWLVMEVRAKIMQHH